MMTKLQAFRAEHLCLRCGNYDEWTEEGHHLCWRCMIREDEEMTDEEEKAKRDARYAERKRQEELRAVFAAYGYKVSLEEPQDDWDIRPDKLKIMRKHGYEYSMRSGKWIIVA